MGISVRKSPIATAACALRQRRGVAQGTTCASQDRQPRACGRIPRFLPGSLYYRSTGTGTGPVPVRYSTSVQFARRSRKYDQSRYECVIKGWPRRASQPTCSDVAEPSARKLPSGSDVRVQRPRRRAADIHLHPTLTGPRQDSHANLSGHARHSGTTGQTPDIRGGLSQVERRYVT